MVEYTPTNIWFKGKYAYNMVFMQWRQYAC